MTLGPPVTICARHSVDSLFGARAFFKFIAEHELAPINIHVFKNLASFLTAGQYWAEAVGQCSELDRYVLRCVLAVY